MPWKPCFKDVNPKKMNKTTFELSEDGRALTITRNFNAPMTAVWEAWTDSSLADQWWAPKPWRAETREMDFRVGGHWQYSMNGPDGEKMWGRMEYREINAPASFQAEDYFCDENGNKAAEMPTSTFEMKLTEEAGRTTQVVIATYPTAEAMKQILEMGLREGFSGSMENLEALVAGTAAGA